MKNLLLTLSLLALLSTACSNEGQETEASITKKHDEKMILTRKENPKLLFSTSFNTITVTNDGTKTVGNFFFAQSSSAHSNIISKRGLYYSGGDCAIWGTILYDDVSGVTVFLPSNAKT